MGLPFTLAMVEFAGWIRVIEFEVITNKSFLPSGILKPASFFLSKVKYETCSNVKASLESAPKMYLTVLGFTAFLINFI